MSQEDVMEEINIYCDESCHLWHIDDQYMALGLVACPKIKIKTVNKYLGMLKREHNIKTETELKWTKLSNSNHGAYKDIINYFFDNDYLKFRCVIINKQEIRLDFDEDGKINYDDFYYKMYYLLLKEALDNNTNNFVYLDIKDTRSKSKIKVLKSCVDSILRKWEFKNTFVKNIQVVQSKEVALMQITDILLGAMTYMARGLNKVEAKKSIINLIKSRTDYNLDKSTPRGYRKFNVFYFKKAGEYEDL